MAVRRADTPSDRPRPRPGPGSHPSADAGLTKGGTVQADADRSDSTPTGTVPTDTTKVTTTRGATARTQPRTPATKQRSSSRRRKASSQLARIEPPQPGQVVAAAGSAIVTAARVGRLLGRSGWRIAKQLPGVTVVEAQAQKLRQAAAHEMFRLLEAPLAGLGSASPEEQRVMMLVQDSGSDTEPLRSAMSELLERSAGSDGERSRDYLFGTIVSQLVPDEARILSALAAGHVFAAVDVVAKQVGRSTTRTVLANVSTVGRAAAVSLPQNVPTYLTRLQGFGLLDFTRPAPDLDSQYDLLSDDPAVKSARASVDHGKQGSAKLVRKTVTLSTFGRDFWTACAPARPDATRPDASRPETSRRALDRRS